MYWCSYSGREYAISICMENTCGGVVCIYCKFTDKSHFQHQKCKKKNEFADFNVYTITDHYVDDNLSQILELPEIGIYI